jgi:hypothetical protein
MVQYLYHISGSQYEIVKVTPKLLFYRASNNVTHTVPRDEIKSDSAASLRFSWYLQPPSWPTEGELGEMYAELHKLEAAQRAAHQAHNEANDRVWKMREAIKRCECREARVSA